MIQQIKYTSHILDVFKHAIPVDDDYTMIPLCKVHASNVVVLEALTSWRNEHVKVYPTQFTATYASTKNWVENILIPNNNRILFLVLDRYGNLSGHIGLANCMSLEKSLEIDNVLKIDKGAKGLFSQVIQTLMSWGTKELAAKSFFLRVFQENKNAIKFYQKNGFEIVQKIPLKKTINGGMTLYEEILDKETKSDKYFIRMESK